VAVLALAFLEFTLLFQVFEPGRVNKERIGGAIAAYLLIGLSWSWIYRLILLLNPAAIPSANDPSHSLVYGTNLLNFRFATLTTVGYGDVVPVAPFARSFANLEALIGQLCPAIFIGRLISLGASGQDLEARSSPRCGRMRCGGEGRGDRGRIGPKPNRNFHAGGGHLILGTGTCRSPWNLPPLWGEAAAIESPGGERCSGRMTSLVPPPFLLRPAPIPFKGGLIFCGSLHDGASRRGGKEMPAGRGAVGHRGAAGETRPGCRHPGRRGEQCHGGAP
jgi:hypothetical protein